MSAAELDTQPSPSPPPASSSESPKKDNIVRDIILWRRKKLSAAVVIATTAIWALMEVYQFNLVTLISWAAIFVVSSMFLWSNLLRLLGKEPPHLSRLELSEESGQRTANTVRSWIEEGVKLMFWVSAEAEWPIFLGVVTGLLFISYVGSCANDLLTFLFIGTLVGMTVPVTYVKNEDRLKSLMEWLKTKSKRSYQLIDEKALKEIKGKLVNDKKDKKAE
ncbi:hypothetical protein L6164_027789 [Bauhinia variegata]|uniref:Uncharacterized protein n=1 Tax=Bauhinia variegata TaxID=167791 RepID=A0ACB9LVM1_BAUVA|nr:hypothetical protein L6164_027789 [Bauhinia variegata]